MSTAYVHPEDIFLVELLLDANRNPYGWQDFLNAFRTHFNVLSCHIYIADIHTMAPRFQEMSGPRPTDWQMKEYMEKYFETDYTHVAILRGEPHHWFAGNLMLNWAEIKKAPVFELWARPNGIEFMAGATLYREDRWSCVFIHNRGPQHGEYTKEEMARCKALSPFIEKSLKLREKMASSKQDELRLKALCNQFRLPTAVINEHGNAICMNEAMTDILSTGNLIKLSSGNTFLLPQAEENRKLQMNVTQTLAQSRGQDLTYSQSPVTYEINGKPCIVGTQAITSNTDDLNESFHGAIIYLACIDHIKSVSAKILKQLFSLTETEARVCQQFSLGKNPKEIASAEHKSLHTVQEQLKNCYQKTKTKGQLELMNLLASLPAC